MIEIIGTQMSEHSLIGDCVGAAVGALLIASTLYIVSKIKQEYKIQDEKNAALLEGENYPDWKLERVETWFKGYKVALIECLLLGFFFGAGAFATVSSAAFIAAFVTFSFVSFVPIIFFLSSHLTGLYESNTSSMYSSFRLL